MGVASNRGAAAIEVTRFFQTTQLFQRLPAVEVSSGIGRVGREDLLKFIYRFFERARIYVFHSQAVAGEGAGGVLLQELLQGVNARGCQVVSIAPVAAKVRRAFSPPRLTIRKNFYGTP